MPLPTVRPAVLTVLTLVLTGCSVTYEESLHTWYADPTRQTQQSHFEWLKNDLSSSIVPGQHLAVAYHAWGLGRKVEARAALRAEANAHPEYEKLVLALLAHWDAMESSK